MAQVRPLEVPVVAPRAVPLITVSTVLQTLASITILLRFLSKRANRSIGLDDWVALVALVFSFGLYITGILICTVGFAGFHMDILLPNQIEKFLLVFGAEFAKIGKQKSDSQYCSLSMSTTSSTP